jgi:hypothetical protein
MHLPKFGITVTILGIFHRSVFYLKFGVSGTGLCLRRHMEPTQVVPIDIPRLLTKIWHEYTAYIFRLIFPKPQEALNPSVAEERY